MDKIKIIKHKEEATPITQYGDILYPFESWKTTNTGAGWYSKVPEEFYEKEKYYILTAIHQNPWEALHKLKITYFDFKEKVKYTCPYNGYDHYWCVPILIFSKNIKFWLDKFSIQQPEKYLDDDWVRRFFPCRTKHGLPFTKVQRSLLGAGYTSQTQVRDGKGQIQDAIVALENGDFLGCKVWIWFK